MSVFSRLLKQTATYWGASPSAYGGMSFDAPIAVTCHWDDVRENILDAQGREVVSEARVYVSGDLVVGGYLALGDYSASTSSTTTGDEPTFTPSSSARPIVKFEKKPNLKGTEFVRVAWL